MFNRSLRPIPDAVSRRRPGNPARGGRPRKPDCEPLEGRTLMSTLEYAGQFGVTLHEAKIPDSDEFHNWGRFDDRGSFDVGVGGGVRAGTGNVISNVSDGLSYGVSKSGDTFKIDGNGVSGVIVGTVSRPPLPPGRATCRSRSRCGPTVPTGWAPRWTWYSTSP